MTLIETALTFNTEAQAWQGTADTDSLHILIASLLLAFVAFVIFGFRRFRYFDACPILDQRSQRWRIIGLTSGLAQ